jgi:curved DNA-binding protein CbpA
MRLGRDVLGLDLYQVLGVSENATAPEIRHAYLRQVRASHPDLNPDDSEAERRTARLNIAARVLLDPALRGLYDRARGRSRDARPAPPVAWYERRRGARAERAGEDWIAPAVSPERKPGPTARKFVVELRSHASRLSLALDEKLAAMPASSRRTATLLLLCAAFWLISSARPRNLMADPAEPRPTSVNPSVLNP